MNRFESFDKYFNRKEFKKFPAKERDEFLEVLRNDLQENGLTKCNIQYILLGNSINTAQVLSEWLLTFDTGEATFKKLEFFINSEEFNDAKKELKFSFLTKLTAYFFGEDDRCYKALYGILEIIQDYCYSSPGIIDPQKVNTFGRNFLAFANPEAGFPDKEAIGLAGTAGLQKKRILSSVFYAAGTNAKKGKISYVNHLKAWLNNNEDSDEAEPNHGEEQVVYNGEENDHAKSIEAKKDQLTPENTSEIKETGCLDEEKNSQKQSENADTSISEKKKKKLSTRDRLTKLLNEYLDEVASREEECRLIIDRLQIENAEKEEELEQKASDIKALTQKVQDAENTISKLNDRINKLEIGMKKQLNISNIVQADLKNSSEERLKALGSRLKGQYEDYLAACELEITQDIACDMAEMLKSQLHDVFEILMNDGINLYRR